MRQAKTQTRLAFLPTSWGVGYLSRYEASTATRRRVGVVGCGLVASTYLETLRRVDFVEVAAVSDLDLARARACARRFDIAQACPVEDLLRDPSIEVVLNLTPPYAHCEVSTRILEADKHLYSEKPLCASYPEAARLLELAAARGLRIGCAPDTWMSGGQQTCRESLDNGVLGPVLGGTVLVLLPGHENWHPSAEIFYRQGGGPVHDFAVYHISALVALLGPVRRVISLARRTFETRSFNVPSRRGDRIAVEIPTYVAGVLEFHGGTLVTLTATYDVNAPRELSGVQLYGTAGSMQLPLPTDYAGLPRIWVDNMWSTVHGKHEHTKATRGTGLAEMIWSMSQDRIHRASAELAMHVLEVMDALEKGASGVSAVEVATTCARPTPMPLSTEWPGFPYGGTGVSVVIG